MLTQFNLQKFDTVIDKMLYAIFTCVDLTLKMTSTFNVEVIFNVRSTHVKMAYNILYRPICI